MISSCPQMFTPSNVKKLVNVTVISLKLNDQIYEIPIYPNTLQSYLKNHSELEQIILSTRIYKNVSKGELQTDSNIKILPGNSLQEKIEYILHNGSEKEDDLTRKVQNDRKHRNIALYIMTKLRHQRRRVSFEKALEISERFTIRGDTKLVANSIIREMVRNDPDYEVEKYLIRTNCNISHVFTLDDSKGHFYRVDGEQLNKIITYCNEHRIRFELEYESDEEDEIIC